MRARASLTVSLAALRTFEAVVRCCGLTEAARELGLTVSAISHQLNGLEASFAGRLLYRKGRRVVPTEVGATLAAELSVAFHAIDLAVERAKDHRPGLTVSVQASFAAHWLLPRLHRFEQRFEPMDINFSTTPRLVDLERERIDCAIRLGPGSWPGVQATLLMAQTVAPVVRSGSRDPSQLPRVLLQGKAEEWLPWNDAFSAPSELTLQTRELVIDAVLAGVGIGVVDLAVVADALARGDVIKLAPEQPTEWAYYFVRPTSERCDSKAQAFCDWLVEEIEQTRT